MYTYESTHEAQNLKFRLDRDFCHYFPPHFHRHIELHYCILGYSDAEIDNVKYRQPEGSVIVIFPYQLHAYGKGDGVSNYLSSLISVDFLEQYSNTLLSTLPENPIVTADRLPIGFREQFIQAYNTHIFPGPNHREICSSLLGAVMGELLVAMKLLEIDKKTGLPINQLRGFWNIVFKTLRRTYLLTLFQRRCF